MKKYYWLKLKDDFFTQKAIKKLRKIAGGDTFTIIYLKMMLISMKTEGKLFHEGIENEFYEELALDLNEDEENVQLTIAYLTKHKLMEMSDNDYYLPESVASTGTETESAERVRKHREKLLLNGTKTLQCNEQVTISNDEVTISNTEIEKELDIRDREDKEKIREKKKKYSPEAEEILTFLNLKSGSGYKVIDSNLKLIDSILKKGYTVEDCYTVIDKKVEEWRGTEYEQYLRPITLFSSKFDGYLNAPINKNIIRSDKFINNKSYKQAIPIVKVPEIDEPTDEEFEKYLELAREIEEG